MITTQGFLDGRRKTLKVLSLVCFRPSFVDISSIKEQIGLSFEQNGSRRASLALSHSFHLRLSSQSMAPSHGTNFSPVRKKISKIPPPLDDRHA